MYIKGKNVRFNFPTSNNLLWDLSGAKNLRQQLLVFIRIRLDND